MDITVRLSSGLAREARNSRITLALEQGATVAGLLDRLCVEYPQISEKLNNTVAVISGRTVERSEPLRPGEEVASLTPISGG